MALDDVQQRNLHRQPHQFREPAITGHAPEQEAAGERQQVQFAGEIFLAHGGRDVAEWPECQYITHAAHRILVAENIVGGPGRQPTVGIRPATNLAHRHDPEAGRPQVRQALTRLLVSAGEEVAEKVQRLLLGQLPVGGGEE